MKTPKYLRAVVGAAAIATAAPAANNTTVDVFGKTTTAGSVVLNFATGAKYSWTAGTDVSMKLNFNSTLTDSLPSASYALYSDRDAAAQNIMTIGGYNINLGGPIELFAANTNAGDKITMGDLRLNNAQNSASIISGGFTVTGTSSWLSNTSLSSALGALDTATFGQNSLSGIMSTGGDWRFNNFNASITDINVPEPSTYAAIMGAMTAGLVGFRSWRKRKNANGLAR